MTLVASGFDEGVVDRMLEFCDESTRWSRRLWQSGTILLGRELLEAGDPANGVSEHALKTLQQELLGRVALDPALVDPSGRSGTVKLVAGPVSAIVKPGHKWQVLNSWVNAARDQYLDRWANALASGTHLPSAERTARLIAGHLLDEGISPTYLHRWLTYRVKHSSDETSLEAICRELNTLLTEGPRSIEVLVPLAAHVPLPRPIPSGWLTPDQVRDWRYVNIPESSPVRQHGGVLLTVDAHDIYSAASATRDRFTTIRDRFRVGGRREIVPASHMWIAGVPDGQPMEAAPRRVEVYAFERQSALWSHSVRADIEAAMELMAPLERGPSPAAVTGAWAAVESLLVGPGDQSKHLAADRLALIVAGGHLRAELTSLAWAYASSSADALAEEIKSQDTNQARAELAMNHLAGGGNLDLPRSQDSRALERVRSGVRDPYAYVDSVRRSIEPALRALYRQRNLLSHSGVTAGVAIKPTLERAAPLVAAGMDRIVHVALTGGHSALELAALARVRHEALRGRPPSEALSVLEV